MGIGHNMKKMTSVMYAEREKDVRNGRRLSSPRDVPPAARKEGTEKVSLHSEITQRTIDNYLVVRWIFCIFK